jgi:hypothetical protein
MVVIVVVIMRRLRTSRRHVTLALLMLVLALLVLLMPLTPSPSQLSSSSILVRALPEEDEASTRMEAEVNGALHVYRDESASLALHISRRFDKPIPLRLSLNASLNVDESTGLLNASLEQAAEPLAFPSFTSRQGLPTSKISFEKKLRADLGNTTTISLEERARHEGSEASLSIFITDKRAVELNAVWEGHLRMRTTGEFSTLIEEVNATDEELLKEMVASLFRSYLTEWGGAVVNVAVSNATKAEDELVMNFCVSINKEKVVGKLRELFNIDVTATFFDEVFSPPSSSTPITFTLSTFQNTTIYKLEGSLVALREDFWKAVFFTYTIYDIFEQYHVMRPIYATNVQPIFYALPLLASDFRIIKGGRLCLLIKEMEGANPLTSSLSIDIITPRVVKKGSRSPTDTLEALGNYTIMLSQALLYPLPPLEEPSTRILSNSTVKVVRDEGVRVRMGDVEVEEVALSDLGSLRVTFATAIKMSVEPLNTRAGEEVFVRGRIDPPMSAPITITVEEPDGSLKTIETKTNDEGLFSISIKPERVGVHVVRAVFSGSELYEPSSAKAFVEVKAPLSPLISALLESIYYVVVVLVVVVGSLIALLKSPYVRKD